MDWLPELQQLTPISRVNGARPEIVASRGRAAAQAWDDFFAGMIANDATRQAYLRAVRCFLECPKLCGRQLHEITAADVGEYLRGLEGSLSKKKQHHAALRGFFNLLVERHLCLMNPAAVARTERLEVSEGKTPQITAVQSRILLASLDVESPVGLRDRAILGILMWTGVRAGSIAKLCRGHYYQSADQWMLRFDEKRRRSREIPVRHDLERFLMAYLEATGLATAQKSVTLFRSCSGKSGRLTAHALTGHDICRMVKRHLQRAGLPANLSPHSFRVGVATDLLEQGVPLADVQYLLGHADPRTTRLYDRRQKQVSRNIVERIRLGKDW